MYRGVKTLLDMVLLGLALVLSYFLRFDFDLSELWLSRMALVLPYVILFEYLMLWFFGVTRSAWRYVGLLDAMQILKALVVSGLLFSVIRLIGGFYQEDFIVFQYALIPWGVVLSNFVLGLVFILGVRVFYRMYGEKESRKSLVFEMPMVRKKLRTLLIGAGEVGVMVAKEITLRPDMGVEVVGFLDDDVKKRSLRFSGYTVLGNTGDLERISKELNVAQVILTMSNVSGSSVRRIVRLCHEVGLPAKIVPKIYELIDGSVHLEGIRDIGVEDLLHRESVALETDKVSEFLRGRCVLVTGAGGSIGSEICRQVIGFGPSKLLMLDRSEFFLYSIDGELRGMNVEGVCLETLLCDICDRSHLEEIFSRFKPEVVFHAAAHKHVPMLEMNPGESIRNNIFGSLILAEMSDKHGSDAFVMISTDKAVNPTSVMGTSKRIAEIIIQSISRCSKTRYMGVRFGNVLGSTGSVIPLFKKQISEGGPLTVTHPEMRRYFMTIAEASQLVLQAGTMGVGGEIFVLDMGEPVKIVDLARDLIRLSGRSEEEIGIVYSGCRPGEKLFEELGFDEECMDRTGHSKIFVGKLRLITWDVVEEGLEKLRGLQDSDNVSEVREAMRFLVPEMQDPHQ